MSETQSTLRRQPPMRVLVVEDVLLHQKLAVALLRRQGCAVTVRDNGKEAVELLDQQQFDLVLMDIDMPLMDGLTATGVIREREIQRGGHTVIVAVTSETDSQRCLDAGMDDYVRKPLRMDALSHAIDIVSGCPVA